MIPFAPSLQTLELMPGFDLNICDKFGMAVADHAPEPLRKDLETAVEGF